MAMIDIQAQLERLNELGVEYAFYYRPAAGEPVHSANRVRFHSASLIKVPILLAWLRLEGLGEVSRDEIGDLDSEAEVKGAGYSWLLRGRKIPFHDALLMMIALSDNLCTNLVIQRAGLERLNRVIREDLGLFGCRLERKLFDYEARARGLDNWITAEDCVQLFDRIEELPPDQRRWVESLLEVNQDDALLKRSIPRDTVVFFHKTGSLPNVIHDWGYTASSRLFLLTHGVVDEPATFEVFGELGKLLIEP
jgi:beta-lactamase class A